MKQTSLLQIENTPLSLAIAAEQAGNPLKAARFYRLVGEQALRQYNYSEALSCFEKALRCLPDVETASRYRLMLAREKIWAITGQAEPRSANLVSLTVLADRLDDDAKRAEAASRLALFKLDSGEHQDAMSIARLAVRIAQIAKAPQAEAALRLVWGRVYIRLGTYEQAQHQLKKALTLAQDEKLGAEEADSLRYLGVVSEENGRFDNAVSLYKQALSLYDAQEDRRGSSDMLNNLGKVAFERGNYTDALNYWDRAQPNYEAIGDQAGRCRILINQCALCLDIGQYGQAKSYGEQALTLSRSIKLRFGECLGLVNLAQASLHLSDLDQALAYGEEALALAQTMGSRRLEGYAFTTLGRVLTGMDKLSEAAVHYWESLAIWQEMDQMNLAIESYAGLAEVYLKAGEMEQAQTAVSPILSHLQTNPTLNGAESVFAVYWHTFQVLDAANDDRAKSILHSAYDLLQTRAHAIADEQARRTFLNNVRINQMILARITAL